MYNLTIAPLPQVNEPSLFGGDVIISISFLDGAIKNMYAATFRKDSRAGILKKTYCDNMQTDRIKKFVKISSLIYETQPERVWFYSKEQHELFMQATRDLYMTFTFGESDIKFFDEYAIEKDLNAGLVNPDDSVKNIAFSIVMVITRNLKK